jgi:hypothetical protein
MTNYHGFDEQIFGGNQQIPGADQCDYKCSALPVNVERTGPNGDAPDFVEVGEAGIAMDDAMRRQRRVQLVG